MPVLSEVEYWEGSVAWWREMVTLNPKGGYEPCLAHAEDFLRRAKEKEGDESLD